MELLDARRDERHKSLRMEGKDELIEAQKAKLKEMLDKREIDQQTFNLLMQTLLSSDSVL